MSDAARVGADPVVVIEHLDTRGDGVGGRLRVPRSLPGEEVTGRIVDTRIPEPKIITPSADRVAAPCPHFKRCGGCALQHASDAFVARWKVGQVRHALARAGIEAEIAGIETSPPASRRRAALAGRKTKRGALVGFHRRGADEIVPIPSCILLHPDMMAALPELEGITRLAAPRGVDVTLHLTRTETGLDLSIAEAKVLEPAMLDALAALAAPFARITWNGEVALQQTPPRLVLGPAHVTPPPGAFLQATEAGERTLTTRCRAILAGATSVVDLFAGLGTFTFPMAPGAAVHAVEGDAPLLEALAQGARHAKGLKPITTERRDLFRAPLDAKELALFDGAVIDPPRAGAAAQVAQLAQSDLPRIAFISCNPVSFARDAQALLTAGWRMGPITVVDQFRWSAHVELVTDFERV